MTAISSFDDIFHGIDATKGHGQLRIANSGIGWKAAQASVKANGEEGSSSSSATATLITIPGGELKSALWIKVARGYQLRLALKNGKREQFDGFTKEDEDLIRRLMRDNFRLTLETKEISVRGWNWGEADFQGSQLSFIVNSKTMFEIPLPQVANSNIAGKTEVSLEFLTPDQQAPGENTNSMNGAKRKRAGGDQLVEMRFHVPGVAKDEEDEDEEDDGEAGATKKKSQVNGKGTTSSDGNDAEEELSAAAVFHEQVKEKADLADSTAESIVLFPDVLILTPRGRYDLDMFATFLRLRGKTYDYKVLYTSIVKLFLLPKPDDIHIQFVIGLDPPIRQGQTRYPFLVLQFALDEEIDVTLNLDDDDLKPDGRYSGKLQKSYENPSFEVVSSVFRGLTGRKVTVPGTYKSIHDHHGIKCSLKANEGLLYPLEKSLIFISKAPQYLAYSEINKIVFSRVGGALGTSRTFDIRVEMQSGSEHGFASLNREEHGNLEEYLKSKKIRVRNEMAEEAAAAIAIMSEESDDEEAISSEDDRRRPTSSTKKATAAANGGAANGDDDDDDDDDESFASGTESEPDEEYDSNGGNDDD